MRTMDTADLAGALAALRDRVAGLRLGLSTAGADAARAAQDELVGQVDDYLLPRLRRIDAPLLAVVGGSTGAGKSTLVNSLVGSRRQPSGWLRPTTRGPVLVCHPADVGWFTDDRVLPELSRTTGDAVRGARARCSVVPHAGVPAGLALIDAPDIDSVVAENRALATQLLAAADLWIFCTTAARYADAVPWDLLHTAQQRSTALAVVLDRVPSEGVREISRHLASMLDENGLGRAALFAVAETPLQGENALLPAASVRPLRDWLGRLAADADARAEVIRTTLDGALASLRNGCRPLPARSTTSSRPPRSCVTRRTRVRRRRAGGGRRRAQRQRAARGGARAVAGVRGHRRAQPQPGGADRPPP